MTVVTAENIHKYTIADLVLPLPGTNVIYPTHERMLHGVWLNRSSVVNLWHTVGQRYRDRLAQDGIDIDNMRHSVKY